jgi:hypothetical protein
MEVEELYQITTHCTIFFFAFTLDTYRASGGVFFTLSVFLLLCATVGKKERGIMAFLHQLMTEVQKVRKHSRQVLRLLNS